MINSLDMLNIFACLMVCISLKIVSAQSLLRSVLYLVIFSLLLCVTYLFLDAPDVAMTEAALGAAITTVIFLNVLLKISNSNLDNAIRWISLSFCIILFLTLVKFGNDIADFASPGSMIHKGMSKYYISNTKGEVGINSFVAAILASYRGFDTLGELCVIFLGGISVLFISSKKRENNE